MATIQTNASESVYQIKRWLGVNEAPEGEARLKQGEAAEMRNFKVTAGGALRKRGGSVNVAGLMESYTAHSTEDDQVLLTETSYSDAQMTLYPRAITDSVGKVIPDGTPVTVTAENAGAFAGYYYEDEAGTTWQLAGLEEIPDQVTRTTTSGGYRSDDYRIALYMPVWQTKPVFRDGHWDTENAQVLQIFPQSQVPYQDIRDVYFVPMDQSLSDCSFRDWKPIEEFRFNEDGIYNRVTDVRSWEIGIYEGWKFFPSFQSWRVKEYRWHFHSTYAESNETDSVVRGLWSGFVGGREVLCAACNGYLWQLQYEDGVWSKTACGQIDTGGDVTMFGFQEKLYVLNGTEYKVWDGVTMAEVEGYRPMVITQAEPDGGGNNAEQINLLTGARRGLYCPDGTSTVFHLPEQNVQSVDYVKDAATGSQIPHTADLAAGTVTFTTAPAKGTDSIEIGWTMPADNAGEVRGMKYAELYNGAQDTRVFLYGDGSNRCLYSGLDRNGQPRADYFPAMNVASIGDANTPVTGLIRHYNKLLAFKLDSAYTISYDTLTLASGAVTAGFYVTPVNRSVGNCAPGQAVLVENQPRTLDGRSVIEWRPNSYGNMTGDQRNAQRISQRVDNTIRAFDLHTAKTFYDKYSHEYYVIGQNGTALVHSIDADAWTVYTGFAATCMINYKDELYFGTADGYLRHFTETAFSDAGAPIDCYWESGSMPFEKDYMRKYSAMIWVGIKPEANGYLKVTAETDRKADFAEYSFTEADAGAVPKMHRIKLKAKKFTYYKLILENETADATATVVSADIRVRNTGYVR